MQELPEQLLGQLPELLAQQGLNSAIYQHAANCLKHISRMAPACKPQLLEQLQSQLLRCAALLLTVRAACLRPSSANQPAVRMEQANCLQPNIRSIQHVCALPLWLLKLLMKDCTS